MVHEIKPFHRKIFTLVAGLCGVIFALGSLGFWLGYRAHRSAEMIKSFKWIHNERCVNRVSRLPPLPTSFKFAVFGDIQIGTAQLPRLIEILEEEAPVAFVVQTGDAVSHADPGHYELFLDQLVHCGLSVPMFVVPGNHDVRNDSKMLFHHYFGPKQLSFIYGGALFILADNALGPFDDGELRWIENALQSHEMGDRHILLFMHRPPINWKGDDGIAVEHLYERLFELLERHDVDYVFSGNWHGYHREERKGTVFVVNGRGGDFDHDARMVPSYCTIVEIEGDSIQERVIELAPRVSIVLKSVFNDIFVAHIGKLAIETPWFASCLLLLLGLSCAFLVTLTIRVNRMGRKRR